jgi:hypothetical protein
LGREKLQEARKWLRRRELLPYWIGAGIGFCGAVVGALATLASTLIHWKVGC